MTDRQFVEQFYATHTVNTVPGHTLGTPIIWADTETVVLVDGVEAGRYFVHPYGDYIRVKAGDVKTELTPKNTDSTVYRFNFKPLRMILESVA